MPTGYHHLAHCERCQIHALLPRGVNAKVKMAKSAKVKVPS